VANGNYDNKQVKVLGEVMNYESLKEDGISKRETRTSRWETRHYVCEVDPSNLLLVSYFTVARNQSLALAS
jgi:hypothetical protein